MEDTFSPKVMKIEIVRLQGSVDGLKESQADIMRVGRYNSELLRDISDKLGSRLDEHSDRIDNSDKVLAEIRGRCEERRKIHMDGNHSASSAEIDAERKVKPWETPVGVALFNLMKLVFLAVVYAAVNYLMK